MSDFYDLSQVISDLDVALQSGLEEVGQLVERDAKAAAPVRTGRLRDSIQHDLNADSLTVTIGSEVDYSKYQEVKKHFLENAVEKNRANILNILSSKI